jgi:hypothetical protein
MSPRGYRSELGEEKTSANGYVYVKTETGWRLKHHLIAEKKLGRPLQPDERVYFVDNDRANFKVKNIEVKTVTRHNPSLDSIRKVSTRVDKCAEEVKNIREALDALEYKVLSESKSDDPSRSIIGQSESNL